MFPDAFEKLGKIKKDLKKVEIPLDGFYRAHNIPHWGDQPFAQVSKDRLTR